MPEGALLAYYALALCIYLLRHTQDDGCTAEVDEVERGLRETQRATLEDAHGESIVRECMRGW